MSDVDNYRAITLSNTMSKILESLLFAIIVTDDDIDEYQFGFRIGIILPSVLTCLKAQSIITGEMAAMYSVALLIFRKRLIELIIGYYFLSLLTVTVHRDDVLQPVCWRSGTVISR